LLAWFLALLVYQRGSCLVAAETTARTAIGKLVCRSVPSPNMGREVLVQGHAVFINRANGNRFFVPLRPPANP
jgi:hypothetical protein